MIKLDAIITVEDEKGNEIGDFVGFIIPQKTPYRLEINIRGLQLGYKIITKKEEFVITEISDDSYGLMKIEKK